MADSHYKSNIIAKNGTEWISGFEHIATINSITATTINANKVVGTASLNAPDITGSTKVVSPHVAGTSYIRIGAKKIIFPTNKSYTASINAEATLLGKTVDFASSVVKGSLALGAGELWVFTAANAATMCTVP